MSRDLRLKEIYRIAKEVSSRPWDNRTNAQLREITDLCCDSNGEYDIYYSESAGDGFTFSIEDDIFSIAE